MLHGHLMKSRFLTYAYLGERKTYHFMLVKYKVFVEAGYDFRIIVIHTKEAWNSNRSFNKKPLGH